MDTRTQIEVQAAAHARLREAERERIRQLSFEERTLLIKSACRAAMKVDRSRRASGIPPVEKTPWPESTSELLRKHAPYG